MIVIDLEQWPGLYIYIMKRETDKAGRKRPQFPYIA
jgi:hypothetical protein